MVMTLHVILAYGTVIGFLLRAFWSLSDNAVSQGLLKTKATRILPHVIDTALLGALLSVGYIFAVAFTRQVAPW